MIQLKLKEYTPLKRITYQDRRYYAIPKTSLAYPSVTTVLSEFKQEKLEKWRKSVGEEQANKIAKHAATHGSALHELAEKFILGETSTLKNPFAVKRFKPIKKILANHIGYVYGVEPNLFSHKLQLAGSIDLVAEFMGKLSIIDFKTSRRKKTAKDIENYFLQTAIYAVFVYEHWGIIPQQLVIIMSCEEQEEKPLIFTGSVGEWISKAQEFLKNSSFKAIDTNEVSYIFE